MRRIDPQHIERVAVRGVNWVGDAVMSVAALRDLRHLLPRARITLVTRPWAEGIFAGADFIDDLLILEDGGSSLSSFFKQVRAWRAGRFDLAVLLPNSPEPALVAWAARVPFRVGYGTQRRGGLLTHPLLLPAWREERHEVFYYRQIIAGLESSLKGTTQAAVNEPDYRLHVSRERRDAALKLLQARGAGDVAARPLVALCPGSTNSRAKRWPAERFAALADGLIAEAGANVLLIGAREELEVSREVVSRMRRAPVVLTGETSLAETVALLSVADLLVTNDTGPAHIASALDRPVLAIFGPTNPLTTRPFSHASDIIRRPPGCAPCMLRDCPIDHRCMTEITTEEVFARSRQLLAARTPSPHAGVAR
ncbi:MAG: lipopolysaccharide heptosyltransferase II [Pyrinomonadaceae bacterium]